MNEIIKNIEEAQMKAEVPAFNVGDTVRVSAKIKEGNRERIQAFVLHSQLERFLTA
jgi:large subunit ribosomal protein L19